MLKKIPDPITLLKVQLISFLHLCNNLWLVKISPPTFDSFCRQILCKERRTVEEKVVCDIVSVY